MSTDDTRRQATQQEQIADYKVCQYLLAKYGTVGVLKMVRGYLTSNADIMRPFAENQLAMDAVESLVKTAMAIEGVEQLAEASAKHSVSELARFAMEQKAKQEKNG